MTEYEKAYLFVEFLNTANFVFSNYMAVVFAMLAASFFLAHRMSRLIAALFLLLYTIAVFTIGFGVLATFSDFANLGVYIHNTAPPGGGDLRWLGPAGPAGASMGVLPISATFLTLAAYLGSLVFFFLVRRNKLQPETR